MRSMRGFTLLELMIVVAILAILAAIALPTYRDYVVKSQLTAALADISGSRSMYESKLMADGATSFDPQDIGLRSETPRCSEINLVSGATGHIECVVRGHPMIDGGWIRITRSESGSWSCSTEVSIPARVKPHNCS